MRSDPLTQLIDRIVGRSWLGLAFRVWVTAVCLLAYFIPSRWFLTVGLPASILAGVALYLLYRR